MHLEPNQQAQLQAGGGAGAAAASDADCNRPLTCEACRKVGCGWCLASWRCVPDTPWLCQGDVDHIGVVGKSLDCPDEEEVSGRIQCSN